MLLASYNLSSNNITFVSQPYAMVGVLWGCRLHIVNILIEPITDFGTMVHVLAHNHVRAHCTAVLCLIYNIWQQFMLSSESSVPVVFICHYWWLLGPKCVAVWRVGDSGLELGTQTFHLHHWHQTPVIVWHFSSSLADPTFKCQLVVGGWNTVIIFFCKWLELGIKQGRMGRDNTLMVAAHLSSTPFATHPLWYWVVFQVQPNWQTQHSDTKCCLMLKQGNPLCLQVIETLLWTGSGWETCSWHHHTFHPHNIHQDHWAIGQYFSSSQIRNSCLRLNQGHILCLRESKDLVSKTTTLINHIMYTTPTATELLNSISAPIKLSDPSP